MIEPNFISKTDLLTTFDFTHRAMRKDLKDNRDTAEVKAKIILGKFICQFYNPTKNVLQKYRISNKSQNKDILITRPDKGNRVVIVDRWLYMCRMYDISMICQSF